MHIERHRTKATRLIHDGREVGTVFRFTGSRGYGIHMPGVYWRRRQPTRHGGSVSVGVERLKDAVDVASRAIPLLPPNNQVNRTEPRQR